MKNFIPADVPQEMHNTYEENYTKITKGTDRLLLFAGDQKLEHLNPMDPEKLFKLSQSEHIGAFAAHLGLIERYGNQYPNTNYIAKLNGKTNLVPVEQQDPVSSQLWSVDDVVALKANTNLSVCGVGYTIYLGSEYESVMLQEAATIIQEAHQHGLIAILWIYPRGKAVTNEDDVKLIAGVAGVAASLGSDFVKLKAPHGETRLLQTVVESAGNTKVICSGGEKITSQDYLRTVHEQLSIGGVAGVAVGRNIHEQENIDKAKTMAHALSKLIYEGCSLEEAFEIIA